MYPSTTDYAPSTSTRAMDRSTVPVQHPAAQHDEMEVNGGEAVDTPPTVGPSRVEEPSQQLVEQPPVGQLPGQAVPTFHLHQHVYEGPGVDEEARRVVERLAGAHGELFSYLHEQIRGLQGYLQASTLEADLQEWGGAVQGALTSQQQETAALRAELNELRTTTVSMREELQALRVSQRSWRDEFAQLQGRVEVDARKLAQLHVDVADLRHHYDRWSKQCWDRLEADLPAVSAHAERQVTGMEARVQRDLQTMRTEYEHLRTRMNEVHDRQATLAGTVSAMEETLCRRPDSLQRLVVMHRWSITSSRWMFPLELQTVRLRCLRLREPMLRIWINQRLPCPKL